MKRVEVVTVFLFHAQKVFLVRRSTQVRTYQNHWAGISGYLECPTPLQQAWVEVREETGLGKTDLVLLRQGAFLDVDDAARHWRVYPFAFAVNNPTRIQLDWENVEGSWIDPTVLGRFQIVPGLKAALARVWP